MQHWWFRGECEKAFSLMWNQEEDAALSFALTKLFSLTFPQYTGRYSFNQNTVFFQGKIILLAGH